MSTLLDKTSLPKWVFIVIIAVGSLCILITAVLTVRCSVIRKRAKRNSTVIDQGPMRRMTVRRGRMVPASNYLSLTGSRFGLNQFDELDTKSGRKSPMQWWNNVKERKHDEMSSSERGGDVYNQRSFTHSTSSLNDEKQVSTSTQEVEPAFPSPTALPSPDRTSFSRPFKPRVNSTFMHSRNLSMIEEAASPHTSVISSRSNPRKSGMSLAPSENNLTRFDRQSPVSSLPSTPGRASRTPSNPDLPRHMAYAGSRSSLGEIEQPRPSLPHGSSRHDSLTDAPQPQYPKPMTQSHQPPRDHQPDYQQRVYRTASTKGTVLRKKSLRRQEVYSAVAT